jgi:hypothetical protein
VIPAQSGAMPAPSSRRELRNAIDEAATYMASACGSDGKFAYLRHLDPKAEPRDDYNVLRHAGAIWALAQYHQRFGGEPIREAIARAWRYLRAHHIAPLPSGDRLAVWEQDLAEDRPAQAKLGGSGLGLVAASATETVSGGSVPKSVGRGLAEFILLMTKPGGSTFSKFGVKDGPSDKWSSLYYPGEAALGLSRWHRIDGDRRWLAASAAILTHLAHARRDQRDVPADHWALIGTADLLPQVDNDGHGIDGGVLIHHARQLVRAIVDEQRSAGHAASAIAHGSFDPDGRTTPAATRIEGLTAILPLLTRHDPELARDARQTVEHAVAFLLRARVAAGPWRGAITRAIAPRKSEPPDSDFNHVAGEIRIDYVQHTLSAWIGHWELTTRK